MRRITYERRVLLLALAGGAPAVAVAMGLLWWGELSTKVQYTGSLLILGAWWGMALYLRDTLAFHLRTLAGLLGAIREGDFSMRATAARDDDAMGEVMREVNGLTETLRHQRLSAVEAIALLKRMLAEIDVAVIGIDTHGRLRLVNQRAERLLGEPSERLLGRPACDLGLDRFLEGDSPRLCDLALPGAAGRWELRRGTFREGGLSQTLLLLSDLTQTLREEERQAWQRLIQVLRHEINNSLAPIDSLAGSLAGLLARRPRPGDWEQDLSQGLGVIANRAAALHRFMGAYARLTRLPKPKLAPVCVPDWITRIAGLETRLAIAITPGPPVTIQADGDQLDQLLINLFNNAVDAARETAGTVRITWATRGRYLELHVEDDGPGLANTTNLFVPFFTTKPHGAGIGLVLCRQIAEAHHGSLSLTNRSTAPGCCATLRLPL